MKVNPCIFTGIASTAEVPVEWECSKEMFARLILLLVGVTAPAIHRLILPGWKKVWMVQSLQVKGKQTVSIVTGMSMFTLVMGN